MVIGKGPYLIPSSSHVSRVPLVSGKRDSRWYCTCSVAIGTLRFAMYFATAFVVKKKCQSLNKQTVGGIR